LQLVTFINPFKDKIISDLYVILYLQPQREHITSNTKTNRLCCSGKWYLFFWERDLFKKLKSSLILNTVVRIVNHWALRN